MIDPNRPAPFAPKAVARTVVPIWITRFRSGIPTLLVLATILGGWIVVHHINSDKPSDDVEPQAGESRSPDTVVLPAGKLKAGNFESAPVQSRELQHFHEVPGRLRYDQTKHVNVKAPLDGILLELVVASGDPVAAGELIAVLSSPEIGQARATILKRQQELILAQQIMAREQTLAKNLTQLLAMLDGDPTTEEIDQAFSILALGNYRQELLAAYSKLRLARELSEKLMPLADTGAIAGRIIRERETERELAETAFRTARDQAAFHAEQTSAKAEAEVAEAERQLNLAWQSLEMLLGYKEPRIPFQLSDDDQLSRLEVRAPFAGTVESQHFAPQERVMRGEPLVALANTEFLFVEAMIRESDWSAIGLETGAELSVSVPALNDRVFTAKVRYFGRAVQPDTNAIPLVASVENREKLLRPGMFVRVKIPIGERRKVLAIRSDAMVSHENQPFVFVDLGGGAFRRVDVTIGQVADEWVEVTHGLALGQSVVVQGAFLLKSELLLQGEGD